MTIVAPHPTAGPAVLAPTRTPAGVPAAPGGDLVLAAWADGVGAPVSESAALRSWARVGGLLALASLVSYLVWRLTSTMPTSGPWLWPAWVLLTFEALPLLGSTTKLVSWWSIDAPSVPSVTEAPHGMRVVVMIPTYNEPPEVVGPTVAAAARLEPAHQTWVLDDGDRPWLAELCAELGVRYVTRVEHQHAKAGNLNHALALLERETLAGAHPVELVAVLDCDHVPLPRFLTATLGYFEAEDLALVQAPQAFFNDGAFDDDGYTGEQGLFFNVQLAARARGGAGTFWCGSTSVLRVAALREVGGVAAETVTEDMHTTLKLQRLGWRTAYHHETVALGLAPGTPEQYLVQRRRWGLGAMQVMIHERLWRRHRWMSWRTQYEYLVGTLWWLEGILTVIALAVPATLLVTGAQTSTAPPRTFLAVFVTSFAVRMWGYKLLMRRQIRWRTAFALRVLRIPVGLACVWWLFTRRTLTFSVTPKGAADGRYRGRVPVVVTVLTVLCLSLLGYAGLGLLHLVPWRTDGSSTVTSGLWLVVAVGVLFHAILRIRAEQYATSRRTAHRFEVPTPVQVDGVGATLLDVSVGGAAVRVPGSSAPAGHVVLGLPGANAVSLEVATVSEPTGAGFRTLTLRAREGDWQALRELSLWLFHTPEGAVPGLPAGMPVVAVQAGVAPVTGRRRYW